MFLISWNYIVLTKKWSEKVSEWHGVLTVMLDKMLQTNSWLLVAFRIIFLPASSITVEALFKMNLKKRYRGQFIISHR